MIKLYNIQKHQILLYSSGLQDFSASKIVSLLEYFYDHGIDGIYHANKGTRELLCSRLNISRGTYQRTIAKLIKSKAIKKRINATGSQYCYYELSSAICDVMKLRKEGLYDVMILTARQGHK